MAEKFLNLVKDINLQNQEVSKCQIGETKENQAHADHNRTPENQRYRKKKIKAAREKQHMAYRRNNT